ncbi:MAG: EamA family transporter [Acidobacteria bacterium]|nr:EamA family transporter [Acidobacteriota bacterium]
MTAAPTRRAYLAWLAVCLIWGTTYLAIRISLETIPPLLMAAMRWIVAGSLLLAALRVRGEPLPGWRAWPSLALLGVLLLGFGIDAFMPGGAPLTLRHVAGLAIGFAGIVTLVWPEIRTGGSGGRAFLGGVMAAQVACVGWAVGSSYARHRGRGHARDENVLATAACEMLFGGMFLLAIGLGLHETTRLVFTPRTAAALVYLTLVGAIGGFTAYAYALKHLPVATVSLYAYVNPIIAVVLGTLVLNEPLNARMAVAAAVVLAGMAMVRAEG